MKSLRWLFVFAVLLNSQMVAWGQSVVATADAIRAEAVAHQETGRRPLPLTSHWNTNHIEGKQRWSPQQQLDLIAAGHFLLPWFEHPRPDHQNSEVNWKAFKNYYEVPIKKARELQLPLVFISTQWEGGLSKEPYLSLPAEENPNEIGLRGDVIPKVSPFGPVKHWKQVGADWTTSPQMQQLQEWYPDPPLVVFLSNNEQPKLSWTEIETSKRYLELYGAGKDDDFKRRVVSEGWIERYRQLQNGLREGLSSNTWRKHSIFVGYNAFGPPYFGRWERWAGYSLHTKGRISPEPLMWDGGSPSYYTPDYDKSSDYTVFSPQVAFQNFVFMQREAQRLNPEFWLELSIWDGNDGSERAKQHLPKPEAYRQLGQIYDPMRYEGFIQFGAWLVRPRVLREYRGTLFSPEEGMPYFAAIMKSVDRVHNNPILRDFWQYGSLVPNRAHQHPYEVRIPQEFANAERWFMLDADVNPTKYPWTLSTQIPVYSLALVQGSARKRRWLVYAHSPLEDRRRVAITIPEFGPITVDVPRNGAFFLVHEDTKRIEAVQ